MGVVSLEGIEFFSYHGVSDEERQIGNRYSIDVRITTDFSEAAQHDVLDGTIDYAVVYKIVEEVMQKPVKLLERIGQQIIDNIKLAYPQNIEKITVSVSKFNPPIGGLCAKATVLVTFDI